jgi:hypothetical protein
MEAYETSRSRQQTSNLSTPVLLLAILVLTWVLRMNFWDQPFEMDEGLHAYMGWGMLKGLVPFKDMYNTKPPGIYVLHSLLFLLVKPTALNIKVFASIYTALLFGIFSAGPHIQGGGVNSEVFMVLPYTLAALFLVEAVKTRRSRYYLLTGFFTGLAATIKQVAVVNLLWVAGYLLFRVWRAKDWNTTARALADGFWVALGSVLPWLPFLLYFYWHDALGKFYFWMVSANFLYIGDGYKEFPHLSLLPTQTKTVLSENGFLWLLALVGIFWRWQELKNVTALDPLAESKPWKRTVWVLLATWPLFSFLGVTLGGRYFPHYYIQMIPPLAVLGGVGLMSLVREVRARRIGLLRRLAALAVAAVLAWTLVLFIKTDAPYYLKYNGAQISLHQYGSPLFSVTRFIGNYLKERTQPDDFVYVWAVNPEINFYALRQSPCPFLMHVDAAHIPWDPHEEVIESLRRRPPKYIVAMYGIFNYPILKDYVQKNYLTETNGELNKLKEFVPFEIYRRKEK